MHGAAKATRLNGKVWQATKLEVPKVVNFF